MNTCLLIKEGRKGIGHDLYEKSQRGRNDGLDQRIKRLMELNFSVDVQDDINLFSRLWIGTLLLFEERNS